MQSSIYTDDEQHIKHDIAIYRAKHTTDKHKEHSEWSNKEQS